jgi:hypothetical protein
LVKEISHPREQQKHPFEEFKREKSAFEEIKDLVKEFLTTYGLKMHSKTSPQGNLNVSHYMTIVQKLSSFINHDLMTTFFKLDETYDFRADPKNTRLKNNQKDYKNYILRKNAQEVYLLRSFMINNSDDLYNLIFQVFLIILIKFLVVKLLHMILTIYSYKIRLLKNLYLI